MFRNKRRKVTLESEVYIFEVILENADRWDMKGYAQHGQKKAGLKQWLSWGMED